MRSVHFSDDRLLEAVRSSADPAWWDTECGRAFLDRLTVRLAGPLARRVRIVRRFPCDSEDILYLLVTALLDMSPTSRRHGLVAGLERAQNQWGYLWATVWHWADELSGMRADVPDDLSRLAVPGRPMEPREILDDAVSVPEGVRWDIYPALNPLTAIGRAVELTALALQPFAPQRLHPVLTPAVSWLAVNTEQHRGHGQTEVSRAGSDIRVLGFRAREAATLAQVCWGVRNRTAETSVLGGYLVAARQGRGFDPLGSGPHVAVLRAFRAATLASESRLVGRAA